MDSTYFMNVLTPMLQGCLVTLAVFAVTIISSLPLGFLFTLMSRSRIMVLRGFAEVYIYILRGTPLLLQLMFVYFGLPLLPGVGKFLVFDRFVAACIAFGLNYAAYFAEIFRGGLLAIDKGQYEASKVLGLTKFETMTRVVIPQMIRVCLPSISNETITLLKDTAPVSYTHLDVYKRQASAFCSLGKKSPMVFLTDRAVLSSPTPMGGNSCWTRCV